MESNEIRTWATNIREHDDPSLRWDNAEELYAFLVKNWEFPGTIDDAQSILDEMYA